MAGPRAGRRGGIPDTGRTSNGVWGMRKKQATAEYEPWNADRGRAGRLEQFAEQWWQAYRRYESFAEQIRERQRRGKSGRVILNRAETATLLELLTEVTLDAENREADRELRTRFDQAIKEQSPVAFRRRMLAKNKPGRDRVYDPVRLAQAYQDLVSDKIRRSAWDALSGIQWTRMTWREVGLEPPEGAKLDDYLRPPLNRWQAIYAVAKVFRVASVDACHKLLKRAGVKGLPSTTR